MDEKITSITRRAKLTILLNRFDDAYSKLMVIREYLLGEPIFDLRYDVEMRRGKNA